MQERLNHLARWAHKASTKLPPVLDYETGAILELLAVAIHVVRPSGGAHHCPAKLFDIWCWSRGNVMLRSRTSRWLRKCSYSRYRSWPFTVLENGFASTTYLIGSQKGATIDDKLEVAKNDNYQNWPAEIA